MRILDTHYEYAGLKLAGLLYSVFGEVGLPLIVGLIGVAWTIHRVCERGAPRDLVIYLLSLVLIVWLVSPVEIDTVRAPRLVVLLGEATDIVQERAVGRINDRFLEDPFEWERIAAMIGLARLLDPDLARETGEFLERCAKPALARAAPTGPNVLRPGTLPYGPGCENARARMWKMVQHHVRAHPFHVEVVATATRHDPRQAAAFRERYLDRIAERALDDPWSPTSEASLVRASLGRYSESDPAQSVGYATGLDEGERPGSALWMMDAVLKDAVNTGVSTLAAVNQGWSNRFAAKQRYFLVVTYGPHVYGLVLLALIGFFPIAGLLAYLPGKWATLLNYGKVFTSVKLWPIGWAALSAFNARRDMLSTFDPPERGNGDVFLAVASMYALVPALSFLVVHLAAGAVAAPFAQAQPPAAGPGLGPAGPAVNVVARAGR